MNGLRGDNLGDHNLPFDQLQISDVPANDKMETSYSNSNESSLCTPEKSSRKNVLVKISAVADIESTFEVAASPDYASPSVLNNSFEANFQQESGNNRLSKHDLFDPDDCTWNPRLHVSCTFIYGIDVLKERLKAATPHIQSTAVITLCMLSTSEWIHFYRMEGCALTPICDFSEMATLRATSGGGRRYRCRCCRKKFLRKRDLNRHQHIVHGVLAYVCKTRGCTQRFETMTDLVNHRSRVHFTNRTPRNCKLCNRKFVTEKSLMMHLRWHNLRPFRCKKCTVYLRTPKEWSEHRHSAYAVEKDQAKPKNSPKNAAPLSKKEEKEIQAVLSRLPAILPKPPRGNHLKIPIPPFHPISSSDSRELRPLMPASFVNSFPEENYVPIYSSRPSPATDHVSEQMVHPPINAILPPQYPQANYENIYPIDSSYYIPRKATILPLNCLLYSAALLINQLLILAYQHIEISDQTNSGYGVQMETDFGIPPVEVVDLNTYPVEITSPTDINWSSSDSFGVDQSQNWLQPINLYGEGQQDAELMQMVEETLKGDLNQDL
ncbi:unnamed protein product [Rodentolepis nana]|uniref:C2H2-type domain-containing protein n=1 Tax=Rodentolepis nana TaxID=102285 RepID=A0A0R3TRW1_RODNA|nr:unnamed protein product [Rodentolepis nana]